MNRSRMFVRNGMLRKTNVFIVFVGLLTVVVPGRASAICVISSARLQQISEREILAIIDGRCSREVGESGYFTEIRPGVYGEVMAVYGRRNIDQYGVGWQSDYGYNIVFPESRDSYSAGVWISDADGVIHSQEMTIRNSFVTTTTSQIIPATPVVQLTPITPPAEEVVASAPTTSIPTKTSIVIIEDDGIEDEFAEIAVRALGNKWLIEVDSSYRSVPMSIKFRKSGARTITWNFVTLNDGSRRILTSRNLGSGSLLLMMNGEVVDRVVVP